MPAFFCVLVAGGGFNSFFKRKGGKDRISKGRRERKKRGGRGESREGLILPELMASRRFSSGPAAAFRGGRVRRGQIKQIGKTK